jgi:hypothetical protein
MEILTAAKYMGLLDSVPAYSQYQRIPIELSNDCLQVEHEYGKEVLEDLHKHVLIDLISQFEHRIRARQLTPAVINLYRCEHRRILDEMSSNSPGFYSLGNDLFLKDLALARAFLIPVGVDFVQLARGIPRSVVWKAGAGQFISCLRFFLGKLRGFGPFLEIHMDTRRRGQFTEDARASCYRNVAGLLMINKHVKGLLAGGWLHDPALETISPRLGFLRRLAVQNGGKVFYFSDENAHSGALRYSSLRRKLFAQGTYTPKSYFVIWPRDSLIKWAATS